MKNITMKVEKDILTITVNLKKPIGKSASGKSWMLATTEGNKEISDGGGAKIGLNVYKPVNEENSKAKKKSKKEPVDDEDEE